MLNEKDQNFLCSHLPFWEHLNSNQREILLANAKNTNYMNGQSIHYGDDECIGVLLLKKGTIRTYITSKEGREITLYRLEEGDICILSASCILQSIDFDVSIDAQSDCEILQISSHVFSSLSSENVYVELFSYQLATERFSDVMWAMQQILFTSFDKRLALFLLEETEKLNDNKINITHDQIAKYLGSAREVVSRMLKYFSKEGYVQLSRGGVTVINRKGLRSIL